MRTSFDWARYLDQGARRYLTFGANPKPKKKKDKHHFIGLNETPKGLGYLKRNDIVWSLGAKWGELIEQHKPYSKNWKLVAKYTKQQANIGIKIYWEDGTEGPRIKQAASKPSDVSLNEYIRAHHWVNDYLFDNGVSFSSPSNASEQLFCQALKKDLKFYNPVGRRLMKGSRGICLPGKYDGPLEKWDLKSAYPSAILANAHKFPLGLKPIHASKWEKHDPSLILAWVYIRPSTEPLNSPIIQEHAYDLESPKETVEWFWDFELKTILNEGHSIQPLVAFRAVTVDLTDELGHWHDVLKIRHDPNMGFRGQLLKAVANTFWGSFASSPMASFGYYVNENGEIKRDEYFKEEYPGRVGGEHIASWINALISDRVFNEFWKPHDVVYFDTDGGIIRPPDKPLGSGNAEMGEWEFRGYVNSLDVVSWQRYVAYTDQGPEVKYSGFPNASVQDVLKSEANERYEQFKSMSHNESQERIGSVHKTKPLVSAIDSNMVGNWQRFNLDIDSNIAPDLSLFGTGDGDYWPVSEKQAENLRLLSEFDTDSEIDW